VVRLSVPRGQLQYGADLGERRERVDGESVAVGTVFTQQGRRTAVSIPVSFMHVRCRPRSFAEDADQHERPGRTWPDGPSQTSKAREGQPSVGSIRLLPPPALGDNSTTSTRRTAPDQPPQPPRNSAGGEYCTFASRMRIIGFHWKQACLIKCVGRRRQCWSLILRACKAFLNARDNDAQTLKPER
jgi:hypothetical protein